MALLRILEGPRYRIGRRDLAALARHVARTTRRRRRGDDLVLATPSRRSTRSPASLRRRALASWTLGRRARRAGGRWPRACRCSTSPRPSSCAPGCGRPPAAAGRENLLRFLDLAERFAPIEGDPGLPAFLEYLQLLDESEEDVAEAHPSDDDAVKVMTIHQAKGLEFATVYVPGLAGSGRRGSSPTTGPATNPLDHRVRPAVVAA